MNERPSAAPSSPPGPGGKPEPDVAFVSAEAAQKPMTTRYEIPSAAPMSPNGPAGRPHPVVLRVYKLHHMIGCDVSPSILAAKVACACGPDMVQVTAR